MIIAKIATYKARSGSEVNQNDHTFSGVYQKWPEVHRNKRFLPRGWLSDLFVEKSGIWYSTSIIDARGNATGGYPHIDSFNLYRFFSPKFWPMRFKRLSEEFWNPTWESGRRRDNFKSNTLRFENFLGYHFLTKISLFWKTSRFWPSGRNFWPENMTTKSKMLTSNYYERSLW